MHHRASPEIFRRAKELRMKLTPSENILWERIRANRLNDLHFRRQHPISKYILDFYCHQYRLGIELDGEIHDKIDQKARDIARQEDLEALGIYILRFKNHFVIQETEEILRLILMEIENIKKSISK